MQINYLTSNSFKFKIAQEFFKTLEGYELIQHSFPTPEIQDFSCEVIAQESALFGAKELGEACITMDAGFYIEALKGFPGPFLKYVNEWLSEENILSMLKEQDSRSAFFVDALAIAFPDGSSKVFTHKTHGKLAKHGQYVPSNWPANSLFIPDGYDIPLGSMTENEQTFFWSKESENWKKLIDFLNQ